MSTVAGPVRQRRRDGRTRLPVGRDTAASDQIKTAHPSGEVAGWSAVDRWVRDPKVRRDALIALGMVLVAVLVLAGMLFARGGVILEHLMAGALSTAAGQVTCGAALTGAGAVALRRHHNRTKRGTSATDPQPAPCRVGA